ncbi:ATP-binding protein [Labilibacter marinus]|uniref:ATP-binding protein n=1 Tax=Labilibacter marinus TaxID=1477105 RepID=UPI00082B42CB|nr:ATP-binding protein [Labilibacter marinus]
MLKYIITLFILWSGTIHSAQLLAENNSIKNTNTPTKVVESYLDLSKQYLQENKNTIALDTLYSALIYINDIPTKLANSLLSSIGKAHYALQNDTVSFRKVYFDLEDEASVIKNCQLLLVLIDFYTRNHNYKKAAESVQRATVLSSKVDKPDLQMKILQKKGIVQFHLNYYDRALDSFKETLPYFKNNNYPNLHAEALRYTAEIYFNKTEYNTSAKLFHQSLQIDSGNHIRVLKSLAKINQIDDKHKEAINLLSEALKKTDIKDISEKGETFYLLAGSYFMLREIEKSKAIFDSSIHYAKEYRDFHLLGKALSGKSKCYSQEKDYKNAAFYLKNAYLAIEESFEQRIEDSYAKENAYYNNIYHSAQIKDLRKDQYINELELSHSKNQNLLLLTIIAGISIGLVLTMRLYIVNKRFNKQLKEKNTIIDNNNQELQTINSALTKSQLSLLNANKVKDRMFSIITHDVKGALTSIRAQLENIDQRDTQNRSQFENIVNSGKNLINHTIKLINHHITWAIKQSNDIKVDKTTIEIEKSIIDKNIELYQAIIDSKDIKITKNIAPDLKVNSDIKMVNLIFRNLLSNAVKHSPLHQEVSISTVKNKNTTIISVEDNGNGIEESKLSELFSLHQEKDNLTHPHEGGSGLYLSYRFAKSMGGKLWAENKKNSGCIFYLEIPNQ